MDSPIWLVVWNGVLTAFLGLIAAIIKMAHGKMNDTDNLLRKTREEIARDLIPRTEVAAAFKELKDSVESHLNRLEDKIDRLGRKD